MNILFLSGLALCLLTIIIGSVLFCKKSQLPAKKNYMVRSISANATTFIACGMIYFIYLIILEMITVLLETEISSDGLASLVVIPFGLFVSLAFCYFAKCFLNLNNFITFALSLAIGIVTGVISVLISLKSEMFTYVLLSNCVLLVFSLFSVTNVALDINIKAQKITLAIIDLVILIAYTCAIIGIVNVGVTLFKSGALGSISDMLLLLIIFALIIIVPPVCVLFSILSNFLSSFEKNM